MAYALGAIPVEAGRFGVITAEAITAGDVCALDSSGCAIKANAALSAHIPAVGIAEIDAASGDRVTLIRECSYVDGASGLDPGHPIYLGETAGTITKTKPTTGTDCVQIIGFALSATAFCFDVGSARYTVA